MTPESYQIVKNILIDFQVIATVDKQEFINKACQLHPQMADYLREILNQDGENAEVFEQSVKVEFDNQVEESLSEINAKISNYHLINKIGSGGMGDVYYADQKIPVERKVALKLLKNAPDQQVLMSEMQILAQLNHPNIATLYDVGQTTDERLFLVMELIEGEDIVSWCDKNQYTIKQRINLFKQLCSGISFAHEKGIIHCDIKPSNVQITKVNNEPIVKVIDFGISQLFKKSSQQSYESISGTPAYLSPEVLNTNGKILADTRRDVFALGVLLYKLIVGKMPNESDDNKNIAVDLIAIINKARSNEVSLRYANANDINLDLIRFLKKQPVRARKENWRYVLTRFVQRRIGTVVFSMALILTLIGGFIAESLQAQRADNQAKIAIAESKKAKLAQTEAEELTGFLLNLFDLSNPERVNQQQVTIEGLIKKANEDLLKVANPTLSDARFLSTIGSIFLRMDNLERAKTSIEKSLSIKKPLLDNNSTEVIADITQLGVIYRKMGKVDKAKHNFEEALSLIQSQSSPELSQLAFIYNHLGNLYWQMKQTEPSIRNHQQALAIRKQLDDEKEVANSYNNLGAIYLQSKQWKLSQVNLEHALDLYQKLYAENHPFIAYAQQNLGLIADDNNEVEKARELYVKSLESIKKIYGKNHNKTLYSQRNLAIFYTKNEQYEKSIELRKKIIQSYAEIGNHEQKIMRNYWLAKTYGFAGDYKSAIKAFQQTLKWNEQTPSKDKLLRAKILVLMGKSYAAQKSYDQAIEVLAQAHEYLKSTNNNHYYNQFRFNLLGRIYFDKNEFDQAIDAYNQVIDLSNPQDSKNQEEVIDAYMGLAIIQMKLKQYESADSHLKTALSLSLKTFAENHKVTAKVYYQLAQLAQLNQQNENARNFLQKVIAIRLKKLPEKHSEIIKYQDELDLLRKN